MISKPELPDYVTCRDAWENFKRIEQESMDAEIAYRKAESVWHCAYAAMVKAQVEWMAAEREKWKSDKTIANTITGGTAKSKKRSR